MNKVFKGSTMSRVCMVLVTLMYIAFTGCGDVNANSYVVDENVKNTEVNSNSSSAESNAIEKEFNNVATGINETLRQSLIELCEVDASLYECKNL